MGNKPKSFVSGSKPTGAQAPKHLTGEPKKAFLPAETKGSMNMGKKMRSSDVESKNSNNRGKPTDGDCY